MIFVSFLKAVGQIGDRKFRRVLLLGIGLTLALLIAAYSGLLYVVEALTGETTSLPIVGEVTWLGDLLSFGSFIFMIVLSAFLMIPVASAITSMFLDEVAQAVEDKHYPNLPPCARMPFWDALRDTINFLGILIAANVVALLLYVFVAPAAPFIFWGLNGYLLGMEYFTLAAARRLGRQKAKELRRAHLLTIWAAGVLMVVPLTIPIVNLLVPVLGAATFTHVFHNLQKRG